MDAAHAKIFVMMRISFVLESVEWFVRSLRLFCRARSSSCSSFRARRANSIRLKESLRVCWCFQAWSSLMVIILSMTEVLQPIICSRLRSPVLNLS